MSYNHLYIIGNGFDIFSGLQTSYADFRRWLKREHVAVYDALNDMYGIDDNKSEWWNDFEIRLGHLDIIRYLNRFTPPPLSEEEMLKIIEKRKSDVSQAKLPPSLHGDTPCANRLRGTLEILHHCFEQWIKSTMVCIIDSHYINIEKNSSFFINFNYTDTLQMLYHIPDNRILFIHGRASTGEQLIFGHNQRHFSPVTADDGEHICFELDKYHKNPYTYIYYHKELPEILKTVQFIHILGSSFSEVDNDYMDWFEMKTPSTSQWEISWYSEEDKERISRFILEHWQLKNRTKLIRLENLSVQN